VGEDAHTTAGQEAGATILSLLNHAGNGSRDPFELVIFFKLQMVTVFDDFTILVWRGAVQKVMKRRIRTCVFLNADISAGAKQAAEKGGISGKRPEKTPLRG